MLKTIKIEGKKIPMISNGGTLREYRHFFKRDMLSDLFNLEKGVKSGDFDSEVLENIAWVLAHRANPNIQPIDEWLCTFDDPYAIFKAYSQIKDLINSGNETTVKAKKKNHQKKMMK